MGHRQPAVRTGESGGGIEQAGLAGELAAMAGAAPQGSELFRIQAAHLRSDRLRSVMRPPEAG